jgi:hypothetical protein
MRRLSLILCFIATAAATVSAQTFDIWPVTSSKDDFTGKQTNQLTIEFYGVEGFKAVHLTLAQIVKPEGIDYFFLFAVPGEFDLGPELLFKTGAKITTINVTSPTKISRDALNGVVSTFVGKILFDPLTLWKFHDSPIRLRIDYTLLGETNHLDLTLPFEFQTKAIEFMNHK